MGKTMGIDLGTYNSAAAVALGRGRVVMVESKYGRTMYGKSFPSFVLFDREGRKQVVGQRAREEMSINHDLVVWGVKRLVGLSYQTALEMGELKRFQYAVEEGPGGAILIRVGQERYTPSHILEFILREIKQDAENPKVNPALGGPIEGAVISIPAYFKAIRTGPIVEAARRAGFEEVDTIAEPTAAAIQYCLEVEREANMLAFDIGAGTLDVTVMLVVREGDALIPGELCTSGHEALGGIDMDDAIVTHVIEAHGLAGAVADPALMAVLKEEVEKAKIRLSTRESTTIELPGSDSIEIGREELERVLAPLLDRCRGPIRVALMQAGLDASDLEHVLFVGGPTHMPAVRRVVREELERLGARPGVLGRVETMERTGLPVDPMECVARGASLKAGKIVEPIGKVIAEGYGTIYGPVPGHDDYYQPIIRENSNYPISDTAVLCHPNPKALEVPIPLVAKRPDTDRSTDTEIVYKYEYLGNYTLGITPTGTMPTIDIVLQVTDDKRMIANLLDTRTQQKVRFEGLDMLTGEEMQLQEHTPPERWSRADVDRFRSSVKHKKSRWTRTHLEHHIHVAEEALSLVADAEHPKVKSAMGQVRSAVARPVENGYRFPNDDCPNLSNRIKELLDTLRQPEVAQITEEDFRRYLDQLITIARMD
jgi:molecular chaperone DnaK